MLLLVLMSMGQGIEEHAGGTDYDDRPPYHVHTWTDATLPQLTQHDGRIRPAFLRYNSFAPFGGNPNSEPPWFRPGGMDRVTALSTFKSIKVPRGKFVEVYRERRPQGPTGAVNVSTVAIAWTFPIGTVVSEKAYSGSRMFAVRTRTRTASGWDGDQVDHGRSPAGFQHVGSCQDCHSDVGKEVSLLKGARLGRDWYGFVRGSDGIFSFRPVDSRGRLYSFPFVRWRK